jgi:hypothetical protein
MKLPIFNTYVNFSCHQFVASQLFLCLFWISLWLRIGVHNTLASKICVKIAQASQNSDSNTQHFHDFTTCSLHSQVTNSLILSWIGVSTLESLKGEIDTSHATYYGTTYTMDSKVGMQAKALPRCVYKSN